MPVVQTPTRIVIALMLVIGSFVVAAMATIAMMPVWRWVESDLGFEAVGHSGPATWCYVAVWGLVLGLGVSAGLAARR